MTAPFRILLTGAGGVLGSALLPRLPAVLPVGTDLVLLARTQERAVALDHQARQAGIHQFRTLVADLSDASSITALRGALQSTERAIALHCAADVAWGKTFEELAPVNVESTLELGRLLSTTSRRAHFLFVSSAYTSVNDWIYRNGYEQTKAEAERRLASEQPTLELSTFSCSLVVGDRHNGEISRFQGIYPLLRLVAANAPFAIGRPDCLIDIVPIDWVADELAIALADVISGNPRNVVAAAGEGRIRLDRMFAILVDEVNAVRAAVGLPARPALPLLSLRRWAFLRRSLDVWRPEGLSTSSLRDIEHLIDIYRPYSTSDEVRAPEGTSCPAPPVEAILPVSIRYWLNVHNYRLRRHWERSEAEWQPRRG